MPPTLIPVTLVVPATVNVFPSADIADTLLKTGRLFDPSLNAIIESVFIPTLPEKLLFALVIAVPTALIWSDAEKYGNIRSNNTVSALNVDIPVVPNVFWNIDFISSTVYAIISLIDGADVDVFSFNINFSPTINVPVVCDNTISFKPVAPRFLARYPIAPLLRPLTLSPCEIVILISVHF